MVPTPDGAVNTLKIGSGDLHSCDVLLYRGKGTLSRLIRLFDGTDVSHAGLFVDGQVDEALGTGLERRSLAVSVDPNHTEWAMARRLHGYAGSMQPVADRAAAYLKEGHGYAYEQLLLLAFLCASRKLPVTPVLGQLLRVVLDQAATAVETVLAGGKQPMICSEFVYRCYSEAVPGNTDPFDLEINLGRQAAMIAPVGVAMVPNGTAPRGRGIEVGSLLANMPLLRGPSLPPGVAQIPAPPPTEAVLEGLASRYFDELRGYGPRGSGLAAPMNVLMACC